MTTFTGHPDFRSGNIGQAATLIISGSQIINANTRFLVPITNVIPGTLLYVESTGATLATLRLYQQIGISQVPRYVAAGTGGAQRPTMLVGNLLVQDNVTAFLYNHTGAPITAEYVVWSYVNTTIADLIPDRLDFTEDVASVNAGATVDVCSPSSAGMFDRLAGSVVASQPWALFARWQDVNTATPAGALNTWDEQVAAGAANTAGFFDIPVRAPVVTLRLNNTGGVAAVPKVSARLNRLAG